MEPNYKFKDNDYMAKLKMSSKKNIKIYSS